MNPAAQIVALDSMRFSYGDAFTLCVEELQVNSGEALCFFGPSGCGKSTLLKIIAGALTPSDGNISICGRELRSLSDEERKAHRIRNIGFVFQDFPLVNYLSALENVLLPYRINPALSLRSEDKQRAQSLLETFGLGDKCTRRPDQLSQGERQRVAIARSLITEPKLILADEPTAGLDPERSQQVMDFLLEHLEKHKVAVICVTHDPSVRARFHQALRFASRATEQGTLYITENVEVLS